MLQGWRAACAQACVSTLCSGSSQHPRGLSWDRSCCHLPAGPAAPGNSDIVSRCALALDLAELTPGWPCGTQTCASHWGEISVRAHGSVPGKATQGLGYPGFHQGQPMLSLEYCGINSWCVWMLWYRLGSRKKFEKTGGNHSDLPEGGNWKQIATKSHGHG